MKWSVTVRKNNKSYATYQKAIKEGWHSELFGLRRWRVADVIPAQSVESGMECYFVEFQGSILYYREQLYLLKHKWRSNSVFPYWLSERGVVKS